MTQMVGVGRLVRDLEDLAGAGTWSWQLGQDRIDWSGELSRIYGFEPGAAPAGYEAFLELVHPDDRELTRRAVEGAVARGEGVEYQHRIVRNDGDVRTLYSLVRVVKDDSGRVTGLTGACQDVTDALDVQERLSRAQALATAGYLATGLSHDLNNLLGVVMFLASAVAKPGELANRELLLEQLQSVARRAAGMTSRIQNLAAQGRERRSDTCDPRDVIGGLASVLHSVLPSGVVSVVDVREAPASLAIDQFELERVLWNLIINAVHAMPDGGEIRVEADVGLLDGLRAGRIVVADDGIGMDRVAREKIFDAFYTTKGARGTGVGMSIVLDIVRACRGRIAVDSEPGRGTAFSLYIPLAG